MGINVSLTSIVVLPITAGLATAQPAHDVTLEQHADVPSGRVFVHAFSEVGLAQDEELEQVSIAPDLWLGITDELTIGVVHSGRNTTGIYGSAGNGVCVSGDDGALGHCEDVYTNGGLEARYRIGRDATGALSASLQGGLYGGPFDPFTTAAKVGVIGRWESRFVAFEVNPNLFIGLTEREPDSENEVMFTSNKETLNVPVTAVVGLTDTAGLAFQVGAQVPLDEASDQYRLAASAGGFVAVTDRVMLEAMFSLPSVARGDDLDVDDMDATDARTLTVGVGAML